MTTLRLPLAALLLVLALPASAAELPQTGRGWVYAAGNVQLPSGFALTLMPGMRFEYARTDAATKGLYLYELFVGPSWTYRSGALGFRLALWYYFLAYPRPGSVPLSHNIELIPTLDYQLGKLNLSYRIIFHNTIYASVYDSGHRWGFGTVMRNLLLAKYAALPNLTLVLGEEPWFGLIESAGVPYNSAGYWQSGFRLNRAHVGVDWKLDEVVTVSPQYLFEATIKPDGSVGELGHYVIVTFGFAFKAL